MSSHHSPASVQLPLCETVGDSRFLTKCLLDTNGLSAAPRMPCQQCGQRAYCPRHSDDFVALLEPPRVLATKVRSAYIP